MAGQAKTVCSDHCVQGNKTKQIVNLLASTLCFSSYNYVYCYTHLHYIYSVCCIILLFQVNKEKQHSCVSRPRDATGD